MRKRISILLSCILTMSLIIGMFISPLPVSAASTSTDKTTEPVDLGTPVQTAQAIDAEFGQEDGVNVAYTTVTGSASAGDYATFSVLDIDNEKLLRQFKLQGASNAWNHVKTPDGRVFIGASHKMFVYSPESKEVTDLGVPLPGTSSIWSLTTDDEGNVYGGIYSESVQGRVFRIDAQTLEITDLLNAPVDSNESYIRSMAYYDGYLYAGTGSTNGRVWKISTSNPQTDKTSLGLPGSPDDAIYKGLYDKMGFAYGMNIHENYLFAFYNGPSIIQVYDLEKQEWTDAGFSNIRGLEAAVGYKDGKVYTSKKDGKMWEISLSDFSEREVLDFDNNIRHSVWMNIANQPDFPNGAMVSIGFNARITLSDPATGQQKSMKLLVQGQGINLQALETGPDGKLYISTYLNSEGAQYDPETGKFTVFPLGQAEGLGHVGDTMYFGIYPKAEVAAWDTTTPLPTSTGPETIFSIGEDQDRPFVVTEGDGKLLLGTIPGYSQTGGALTIYDPAASEASGEPVFEVFRNVVQDQSITGLLYKDGLIYGSTSISGGLGNAPTGMRAKLFVWDVASKKKIHEWEPQLEGLSSLQMISGLQLGPDGLIWAAANGIVFAFDPDTREIVKSRNIHPDVKAFGKWRPVYQRFSSDGLLYSNAGEKLVVIDPETMAYRLIKDKASLFTLDREDNLYVAESTKLLKYPPSEKPVEPEQPEEPKKHYLDIHNSGFEEAAADGSIPGWTVTAATEGVSSVTVTDDNKYTGDKSLKLVDASTTHTTELMSDPLQVIPGRTYMANFNMYLNGSFPRPNPNDPPFSSSRSSVGVRYYDANNKLIPITSAMNKHVEGPQYSWLPIEMTTVVPDNAVTMRLVLFTSPLWVSTTHYDEVSVYTVIDPSEVPEIRSAEFSSTDVKEGSDLTLSVAATEGAAVTVKEGDTVVAEAVGTGETPVQVTIPAPSAGTHQYTVSAHFPLLTSSEELQLPVVNVHGFSGYTLNQTKVTLVRGEKHTVSVQASYGPLTEDVTAQAVLSTKDSKIVQIKGNTITADKKGDAEVIIKVGDTKLKLKVTVLNKAK
ncbi:hypothetical protein [Paenibacillus dakarensis]|uniref:hypothetical protein n=1 Tax=Paenibacillus dakarensis TaxID=1527293 RepID=UPI0006D5402D|nr:hypothetical protein [Paenibacillus dakarensis]